MRPIDRAVVGLAKHAPSLGRLGFRVGRRWAHGAATNGEENSFR
jgi:hypothetical protein